MGTQISGSISWTVWMLNVCCHSSRVHWTGKLASKCSRSKSCGLISVGSIATQNFQHWLARMRANWLLDSAKSRHVEPSDRLAAKKTDDRYQGKWWPYSQRLWSYDNMALYKCLYYYLARSAKVAERAICLLYWIWSGLILCADDCCCYFYCMFELKIG